MKKLFVCLCAGVLLAGCGAGSSEKVSKVCSLSDSGVDMTMTLEAEGDTLTKADIKAVGAYENLGITKEMVDALSDEERKEVEELMIENTGFADDDSVDAKAEFTEKEVVVSIVYNVSTMEKTFNSTSLKEMVERMEKQGMSCK